MAMASQASLYFMRKHRRQRHLNHASAVLTFTGNPSNGNTVSIGGNTFLFGPGGITIAAGLPATITNLANAMAAGGLSKAVAHDNTTLTAESVLGGHGGRYPVSTNVAGASWSSGTLEY